MIRKLTICLVVLVALSSSVAAQEWQTFTSPEGRFSVSMPGTPQLSTSQSSSPVGAITTNTYDISSPGEDLSVSYADLPSIAVFFGGAGRIFSGAVSDFLKTENATQLTLDDTSISGHPGKVMTYQMPDGSVGKAMFYLVGARLYVLTATRSASGPVPSQPIDDFFSSFTLQS